MLVLSRKVGESIQIANDIVIVVVQVKGERARLGIEAPRTIRITRGELLEGASTEGRTEFESNAGKISRI